MSQPTEQSQRNKRFPSLAELRASPDSVELLNSAGRISFIGQRGLAFLELKDLTDVVGRNWWDFWPDDQQADMRAKFDAALAGTVQEFEVHRQMSDGTVSHWRTSLSPVPGVGVEEPTSVLVVSRQISSDA